VIAACAVNWRVAICRVTSQCISSGGTGTGTSGGGSDWGGGVECSSCSTDAPCGDGIFAGCWLNDNAGNSSFCVQDCTDSGACPSGSSCSPDQGEPYSTCIPDAGTGGTGGGGSSSSCTSDTWSNFEGNWFAANCARCHGWASSHTAVASRASANISWISNNSVPPSSSVSASDKARVLQWLGCGAH